MADKGLKGGLDFEIKVCFDAHIVGDYQNGREMEKRFQMIAEVLNGWGVRLIDDSGAEGVGDVWEQRLAFVQSWLRVCESLNRLEDLRLFKGLMGDDEEGAVSFEFASNSGWARAGAVVATKGKGWSVHT